MDLGRNSIQVEPVPVIDVRPKVVTCFSLNPKPYEEPSSAYRTENMVLKKNPIVFLDISVDERPAERMEIELFADVVPKTAENFRALCTGEKGIGASTGMPLCYKGSVFHRIVKGFVAQGGDFSKRDGSGGESAYGRKFPDENFKLKHDGLGFLSMASATPNSNGSIFSITFRATPQLDGKNVVFGKVVSGSTLLKQIEKAGSDKGKPLCLVKIVDCGEVSDGKNQVASRNDKEKKLAETSSDSLSDDSSGGERKSNRNRATKDKKKKRKRRYSSSDSYSSDDSDSYSSDSGSSSDSDSSDTSSSSGARYKRRKRTSRKNKDKHGKRKDRDAERRRRHNKKPTRKSKRSSKSYSDSESETTSSSSFDKEKSARHVSHKIKHSLQASGTSAKDGGRNQSPSAVLGKEADMGLTKKSEQIASEVNASRDEGQISQEHRDHHKESRRSLDKSNELANQQSRRSLDKSNELANQPPKSNEKSSRSRSPVSPKGYQVGSASPTRIQHNIVANQSLERRISRSSRSRSRSGSPRRNSGYNASEPAINHGLNSFRKSSPSGPPKRIRKGRGFSEQYAFVRKYRTPSPERSPVRSNYYRGRYEKESGRNRYPRRPFYTDQSPTRRYGHSPRRSSPSRSLLIPIFLPLLMFGLLLKVLLMDMIFLSND
ncbi:peptidyl-prolyl cis-trans isomerase CYP63-like isoform X2 [Canna indica]|uniref:peptidylprolyl isomerase n=1 Tax=Canna indica TaxID=4628 RepID=A0AAQ3JZS0_9LILI|nr:peptidyl-prolyl cis-trans isomerase CYP63-like isoform X2 [Canna indica]